MDRTRSSRSRLFLGCAGLALAAALAAPQQLGAQAFNANPEIINGTVDIDSTVPSVDTITVSSPTAVIDWFPFEDVNGDALTFLPAGNTAFFQDAPGQGGFAVLNRIMPSTNGNIVVFDGRVVSQLQDISGNFTPGGFVAFYSPTGILVGSTAVFDVGQLLLTTLDVAPASFDAFYTQGGALSLSGPFDSTAGVEIQAGAMINAPAEGSFFIVAAPQVTMSGTARTNGSTAYVAGTSMTFGYANGLFDIAIQQGTSVGNAIVHDGSTGGPASTGAGDNHVIYGVAASQFDPITMLFGGNLGFDPAVSATVENGDIILAANYDVSGRLVAGGDVSDPNSTYFGGNETGSARADISILPGTYSSRFTAVGSHDVHATATTGDIAFTDDATLVAREVARMLASDGFLLSVAGNARVDASNAGAIVDVAEVPGDLDGFGKTASIAAETGGRVSIAGNALVQANGFAGYETSTGTGGSGAGGVAEIAGNAGTVDIDGSATVSAIAGGFNISGLLSSGSFTGGDAHIFALNGGSVGIAGDALVEAEADSTALIGLGAQAGGATTGGQAQIGTIGTGGSIVIGGSATLDAGAFGQAAGSASLAPGLVTGGEAILFTGSNGIIDIGLDAVLNTSAEGRDNGGGGQGGSAVGGRAIIQSNGTSITIGGGADLDGEAVAGDGGSGAGVRGGDATGGLASIEATSGTISVAGFALLDSNADGGTGGVGGDANAGRSQVLATGTSSISLGSVVLVSFADGGDALDPNGDGGQGNGGEAELVTLGSGNISVTDFVQLIATGVGGDGHNGGAASTRFAGAYAITGSIDIGGDFNAQATAFGGLATLGFGGQGGDAVGGTAFLQADGTTTVGASLSVGGVATLDASGLGGTGGAGDGSAIAAGSGGLGRGGTFDGTQGSGGVFALAGRDTGVLDLGAVTMTSTGVGGMGGAGGSGQSGGAGGEGFGGSAQAGTFLGGGDGSVDGGSASYGSLTIQAGGFGGTGGAGQTVDGAGGAGSGGFGVVLARGTSVTADAVQIFVHGAGGTGSTGGDGVGGASGIGTSDAGSLTFGSLISDSSGFGGQGLAGNGGLGTGGDASGDYDGVVDVAGDVSFFANGSGGASTGGVGGAGIGGTAAMQGTGGSANIGGTLFVNAHGFGGDAQSVDETAGNGIGGTALLGVTTGATMTLGAAQVSAGGQGGTGPAATGGNGTGGTATISADGANSAISVLGFAPGSTDFAITPSGAMLSAFGHGGDTTGGTGIGGTGQGGSALLTANVGGSISLTDAGPGGSANIIIARALAGGSSVDGGRGGMAIGGANQTIVDGGNLSLGQFVQSSFARGGFSDNLAVSVDGGEAIGGTRLVSVSNGGSLTGSLLGGGTGAQGGDASGNGNGGDASGGNNSFIVDNATVTLSGRNAFFTGATGGSGAIGGNATGALVAIDFRNGANVTMVADSQGAGVLGAGGTGNFAIGGAGTTRGGDALGDTVSININNSSFTGGLEGASYATGGAATGGRGGDGSAGSVLLLAQNSTLNLTSDSRLAGLGVGGQGTIGGNGFGGSASFDIATDASMTATSLVVEATGVGGAGTAGDGGTGNGGSATGTNAGQLAATGSVSLLANGTGGVSTGGAGGAGIGGVATLDGAGGSADIDGTLFVNAHGFGGDALTVDQTAGDGTGGTAFLGVTVGATMTLGAAQVSAGGQGGTGPAATGGNGTGGSATISSDGAGSAISILSFAPVTGPVDITPDSAMLSAFGRGGDTTGGTGIGGEGQGGLAQFFVTRGGSITLADDGLGGQVNTVVADALGGASSVDGGSGGAATGGRSQITVDNGTLSVGEYAQSSNAQAGASANSALSITGGDAIGGNRTILVTNGGDLTGTFVAGGSGAQGGDGSGGGNGGNASGGTNLFSVDGASVTLSGFNGFFSGALGGSGAIGGNAFGGNVIIQFTNGADVTMIDSGGGAGILSAGGVDVIGGAGVTRGGDARGDDITIIVSDSSFSGAFDALSQATGGAASNGRGGDANASSARLILDGSSVTLTGDTLFGTLAVGGSGATGGNAFGGGANISLFNGADLTMDQAAGVLTVSDEVIGGTGSTADGTAEGGSASFFLQGTSTAAVGSLRLSTLTTAAGGDATGGAAVLFVTENSTANFGTVEVEAAANSVNPEFAGQSSAEVVSQSGANIDIGTLTMFSSDTFFLGALSGSMALGNLATRADGTGVSQIQAVGGSIPITGTADITVAGGLLVTTGQGGIIGGPSVAAPTAIITIDAGGTVSFAGDNDAAIGFGGQELTITSTELDITDGARIGAELVNLNVRANDAMTIVGGDIEEAGYTLTQQEAGRIEVGDVHFRASFDGSASDDLLIRDLTINGSADDGTHTVNIGVGGTVRVEGTLAYINAIATDSLGIEADRLEIVTPGGIGIVDSGGDPTGSFEFFGNDFWMADADTIAQLQEDRNFAGRDELLASVAVGSDDPLGYLRAGNAEFYLFGGGSLLVRNTGTADAPGGITVTGSLEFESGQSQVPLDVFGYGRLLNPDGSFVTGADFFRLVNFNRAASGGNVTYADGSMFNDCEINNPQCGEVVEPPTQELPPIVTSPKTITGPLSVPLAPTILGPGPAEKNQQFGLFFPGLIQTAPPSETDVIDDPVTSGGDSALFDSTEQTEGSEAEECDLDSEGAEEEECDDR